MGDGKIEFHRVDAAGPVAEGGVASGAILPRAEATKRAINGLNNALANTLPLGGSASEERIKFTSVVPSEKPQGRITFKKVK